MIGAVALLYFGGVLGVLALGWGCYLEEPESAPGFGEAVMTAATWPVLPIRAWRARKK